jgi:hypothetical protein
MMTPDPGIQELDVLTKGLASRALFFSLGRFSANFWKLGKKIANVNILINVVWVRNSFVFIIFAKTGTILKKNKISKNLLK